MIIIISVVIEVIASVAEVATVAGEVAGEAAVVAEEASIAADISGTAGIVAESIEAVAGPEIEGVVAEVEGAEVEKWSHYDLSYSLNCIIFTTGREGGMQPLYYRKWQFW